MLRKWFFPILTSISLFVTLIIPQASFAASNNLFLENDYHLTIPPVFKPKNENLSVSQLRPVSTMVTNPGNIKTMNSLLIKYGESRLPRDTIAIKFRSNGTSIAITRNGNTKMLPMGFWGSVWKYTKCAAFLTAAVIPYSEAFRAIKALGGIKTTVKLLTRVGNARDFLKIGGHLAAEILGIDGIVKNCF